MKDYLKVKEILLIQAKPTSKYNKLLKISLTSNDSKLKELVTELANVYKLALTPGYTRTKSNNSNPDNYSVRGVFINSNTTWRNVLKEVKEEVNNYVDARIAEQKPAWQVEAEKHGWTPPQ